MYQANSPRVTHETLAGETIIIDTRTGYYYTGDGLTSVVWVALADGVSPDDIVATCEQAGVAHAADIRDFIQHLLATDLLVPARHAAGKVDFDASALASTTKRTLAFKVHTDLQELIELDPIHEVDPTQGWPVQNPQET